MPGPVLQDGALNEAAVTLLHAVSGVEQRLLRGARIRPARTNWLRAPWYAPHRGGAITVGRTIWFTRIWFDRRRHGDGSLLSCWRWLLLLAHEVGHLPQAERHGRHLLGKAGYVGAFLWQYASRAVLLKRDIHDGSPLEREADRGRWVLMQVIGERAGTDPMVAAVAANDTDRVREWCERHEAAIRLAHDAYHRRSMRR